MIQQVIEYGTASYDNVNNTAKIAVADNTSTTINFGGNNFSLYNTNGHTKYTFGTQYNANQVMFIEDYADQNQGGAEAIEFDIKVTNTHIIASINNKTIVDDAEGNIKDTFAGIVTEAGTTNPNETNRIHLVNPYGKQPCTSYTINDVTYDEHNQNVQINDDGWNITVPGAVKYTIRGEADQNFVAPRTIIWTNPDYVAKDAADADWVKDFKISHATAKVIEVYDPEGNLLKPSDYINRTVQPDGSKSDENGLNNGFGWVSIIPGSRVVFEFVPEYGYQLTGITINETPLEATSTMNRFEFTMPRASGNVHFGATFAKTDDIVKSSSDKISSGTINLGNKLAGGSAQLTVSDVALADDKIAGFENAAGDYQISNYIDIDLYNVYYKGKNDSEDVWSTKISELDEYATITMKLEEGINADDIVIVHNIHDGDEYEIIKIDSYDPETNTITFKTKSFSSYAIATKGATTISNNQEAESTNINTPKTGDNIVTIVAVLAVSTIGALAVIKINKNHKEKANK